MCSVQSAEPPFLPVRQIWASALYLVLQVQMRGRWCAFTINTNPSINNKNLCFKELPSYGDKRGMKTQLFTLFFLYPLAVSQLYLTILLIIVQSWPLKVRGFLHCCSPLLSKTLFPQEPSEQDVLDQRCESLRQIRCITLSPCREHCGWAPVVEHVFAWNSFAVGLDEARMILTKKFMWTPLYLEMPICGIWYFLPSKYILIGKKLN